MPLPEPDLSIAVSGCRSGTRIACRVQPRASRTAVAGILGGALKVALTAPPVDGKANAALCEFSALGSGGFSVVKSNPFINTQEPERR